MDWGYILGTEAFQVMHSKSGRHSGERKSRKWSWDPNNSVQIPTLLSRWCRAALAQLRVVLLKSLAQL